MSTLPQRLKSAVTAAKKAGRVKSARATSQNAGLNVETLQKISNGKVRDPGIGTIALIAKELGVSPAWLAYGTENDANKSESPTLLIENEIAAGVWKGVVSDSTFAKVVTSIMPDTRFPAEAQFLLRVQGQSMNKVMDTGDLLLCVKKDKARISERPGDIVIVESRRDPGDVELSAKRFSIDQQGNAIFSAQSTAERWAGYTLPTDSPEVTVTVIAIAIRVIRDLR